MGNITSRQEEKREKKIFAGKKVLFTKRKRARPWTEQDHLYGEGSARSFAKKKPKEETLGFLWPKKSSFSSGKKRKRGGRSSRPDRRKRKYLKRIGGSTATRVEDRFFEGKNAPTCRPRPKDASTLTDKGVINGWTEKGRA